MDGLLDVARQNFKEVTSDVFNLVDGYKGTRSRTTPAHHTHLTVVEYEIDITLKFEENRGYYMITKKAELAKRDLPGIFTNATIKGDKVIYDSLDLCKMNAKLQHSLNEIYVLSLDTIVRLNDNIREYIGCLYKVCEGIAMLDMVSVSLAPALTSDTIICSPY